MEITRTLIALMAEQPAWKRGRPATRTQDWETTHKWICLLNITFERWRALKDELKLPNDDSVASFLLSLYTELKSGNNNPGQQDEPVRRECDLSASIPLILTVMQGQFPHHWHVDLQQLAASLFVCSAYRYTKYSLQHLEMHKESYTPLFDQLYWKYGRLLLPFLFTHDIEICNNLYFIMSCLTSFVYKI